MDDRGDPLVQGTDDDQVDDVASCDEESSRGRSVDGGWLKARARGEGKSEGATRKAKAKNEGEWQGRK